MNILSSSNIANLKDVLDSVSNSGETAFYSCVSNGFWEMANRLIDLGADPNLCGNKERSPKAKLEYFKNGDTIELGISDKDLVAIDGLISRCTKQL